MKKTIYKYTLDPDHLVIEMPKGAKILSAREQRGNICVWAEVKPDAETEERFFEIFGTGHPMHVDMGVCREFIDTVMMADGDLVFHVYEYTGV